MNRPLAPGSSVCVCVHTVCEFCDFVRAHKLFSGAKILCSEV